MYFMWVPPASDPDGSDDPAMDRTRIVLDPAGDPAALRRAVHLLTLDQLVAAWLGSDAALAEAHDVHRRAQVVTLREMVLDEVEARRPRVYRHWLRDGGPRRR
jgi:hypothetical protein